MEEENRVNTWEIFIVTEWNCESVRRSEGRASYNAESQDSHQLKNVEGIPGELPETFQNSILNARRSRKGFTSRQ
jgi:hypothetical protein